MMVFAAITAAVPIVICVVIIVTSRRAASGKLPRNQYVGIRTPSTMRSDAAWVAAHRAATRLTPLYLVITAIVCAAVLWAALYASSPGVVITVGLGGFAVLIVALLHLDHRGQGREIGQGRDRRPATAVRIRTRLIPVAVAVVVSAGLYAIHLTSAPPKHTVHAPYSTTEALEFLLFSTGRVVADHPDLAKQSALGTASDAQARTAVESVTRCVDHLDATAGPALTAAFNAADPQRLDGALQRFDAAARRWVSAPYPQDAPCPEPPPPPKYGGEYTDPGGKGWWRMNGEGYLNYVFYG